VTCQPYAGGLEISCASPIPLFIKEALWRNNASQKAAKLALVYKTHGLRKPACCAGGLTGLEIIRVPARSSPAAPREHERLSQDDTGTTHVAPTSSSHFWHHS
jgi:hypothetical protein